MKSPHKLQFTKLKYPFSTSDHLHKTTKSFLSNYRNQLHSPQILKPTIINNYLSPSSNTQEHTISSPHQRTQSRHHHPHTNLTRNSNDKYFFVPNIERMKHLSTEAIDTMLNTIESIPGTEPYNTIFINNDRKTDIIRQRKADFINRTFRSKTAKKTRLKINKTITPMQTEECYTDEVTAASAIDNTNVNDSGCIIKPHFLGKTSKLLLANVNQSNHDLLNGNQHHKHKTTIIRGNQGQLPSIRRSSLMHRLILKVVNPNDCIEEYLTKEYPGDRYKRFKSLLVKEKDRINKMMNDITKHQNQNANILKAYVNQLKCKKTLN